MSLWDVTGRDLDISFTIEIDDADLESRAEYLLESEDDVVDLDNPYQLREVFAGIFEDITQAGLCFEFFDGSFGFTMPNLDYFIITRIED